MAVVVGGGTAVAVLNWMAPSPGSDGAPSRHDSRSGRASRSFSVLLSPTLPFCSWHLGLLPHSAIYYSSCICRFFYHVPAEKILFIRVMHPASSR